MAYSMFERPKLQNARSLKLYPQEYEHHVSFRHKNLPPDFEMTAEKYVHPDDSENYSVQRESSTRTRCPIYVHHLNEGDFAPKKKSTKSKQKAVIHKLEETYWANWKPDKNDKKKLKSVATQSSKKSPEIEVIKSAPLRRSKIKVYPNQDEEKKIKEEKSSKSQEIQTDEIAVPPKTEEVPPPVPSPETEKNKAVQEEAPQDKPSEEIVDDSKFLKHTDSFILNMKKQNEEKERLEQPKCIRLYRKPGKNSSSRNFIKGGSYPLTSCLKKESNLTKGSIKPNRPGSPIIVSSNFNSKGKHNKFHRH